MATTLSTVENIGLGLYLNRTTGIICIQALKGVLRLYDMNGRLIVHKQVIDNEAASVRLLP